MLCPLCSSVANHFYTKEHREYYFCSGCFSVFLNTNGFLSKQAEKAHYECHNNDINDPKYQQFAAPIVNNVLQDFTTKHRGLDFGSGTNSVIIKLLKDQHYKIEGFDPFFSKTTQLSEQSYNYITCCEVMEHFHQPKKEFELLRDLLIPGGKLYCMTDLFSETSNFDTWYYKNDPTHVFFYHKKTIAWIAEHIGFSKYSIDNRLIIFEK